jgi:hypothetical protein
MEDELFEQNMAKLRSILGWKNVGAGEVHTFPSNQSACTRTADGVPTWADVARGGGVSGNVFIGGDTG